MDQAVEQRLNTAFGNLQDAIEEYFAARAVFLDQRHDDQCDDPLCPDRVRPSATPQSLSGFVVLAELTAMTADGSVITHADHCFQGSAMSALGMITHAQWALMREGH